jgi:hypothetical protein
MFMQNFLQASKWYKCLTFSIHNRCYKILNWLNWLNPPIGLFRVRVITLTYYYSLPSPVFLLFDQAGPVFSNNRYNFRSWHLYDNRHQHWTSKKYDYTNNHTSGLQQDIKQRTLKCNINEGLVFQRALLKWYRDLLDCPCWWVDDS